MRRLINISAGNASAVHILENTDYNVNYRREIPRDLFNEANLLKCYGALYIELESIGLPDVKLVYRGNGPFQIAQDSSSGFLTLANVHLIVRGLTCQLSRPLNSRESYPLYLTTEDDDIEVFTSGGKLTPEMIAFLKG